MTTIRKRYDFDRNTYIHKDKSHWDLEVGDSKQDRFYPQVKIKRWNNEANASFRLVGGCCNPTVHEENNKIVWRTPKSEAHFYELPNGDFEFEVIFKKKPSSNEITFSINTKELIFHYQPPLTLDEIAEGCRRPENVVGSYAVYHKTKKHNEYGTGKAFHIYRPHAMDAVGNETWCNIDIDEEQDQAVITVPQEFLNKAKYPVKIDPTFGKSAIGASDANTGTGNQFLGSMFDLDIGPGDEVELSHIYFYNYRDWSEPPGQVPNFRGIVTTSGGTIEAMTLPGQGVAASPFTWMWTEWDFESYPTITGGGDHCLGWIKKFNIGVLCKYDTVTDKGRLDTSNSHDSPTDPTDWSLTDREYSIYALYGDVDAHTSLNEGLIFGDSASAEHIDTGPIFDPLPLEDGITFGDTAVGTGTQTWSETLTDGINFGDDTEIQCGTGIFGYKDASAPSDTLFGHDAWGTVLYGQRFNTGGRKLIPKNIKLQIKSKLGDPTGNIKGIICEDDGTLLAVGSAVGYTANWSWVTSTISDDIVLEENTWYMLGFVTDLTGADRFEVQWDSAGSSCKFYYDTSNSYSSPANMSPKTLRRSNCKYLIYSECDLGCIYDELIVDGIDFGDSTSTTQSGTEVVTDGITFGDEFGTSTAECLDVLWTDDTDEADVQFTDDSANEDVDILWTDCLRPFVLFDTDATDGITFGDSTVEGFFSDDGIVFGDTISGTLTVSGTFSEGVDFGDTLTPELTVAGTLSDGMTFGDSVSVELIVSGTLTDGIVFGEPIVSTGDSAEDGLVFGDTTSATLTIPKSTSDGVVFGDTTSRDYIAGVIATDGVVFGDTPTTSGNTYAATATDGVVFGEVLDTECVFVVTLSDGTVIGDTATPNNVIDLAASDGLVFGDSVAVDVTFYIELDDGVEFGESLVAELYTAVVSVTDGIVFSDVSVGEKHTISATFVTKDRTYQFIIKSRAYQFVTKDRVIESIALTKPATFVTKDRTYTFVARTRPDRRQ